MYRRTSVACLFAIAFAQDATFRATVPEVLVPATVTDSKGKYIDGLSARDFILLDNGTPQQIRLDTADAATVPLAVLFVVQADEAATAAVLKIRKVGSTIQPLITGERGHAAVLSYGLKPSLVQDFTSDPEEITRAFKAIKSENDGAAAMLDAVAEGATLLVLRPSNERRIIVVVGETRDRGSKTKLTELLKFIERGSITVFSVVYSAYLTPFTTKAGELPPPEGGPNFLEAITRLGKTNAAAALADASGGRKLSFATLRSLERIMGHVGEELHSQYLLSYTPPRGQPGFHTVTVKLREQPGAIVRNRPGYWSDEK